MSPKIDNQEPEAKPDITVDIPHDEKRTPPAPATAPPLPMIEPLPIRPIRITDNVSSKPPTAPVVPPVLQHEFHEHEGRRWPVILMYTALAFLVAVAVVFAGRWAYRKATHPTAKTTKPETSANNKLPAVPPTGNQQPSSGGTPSSPTAGADQNQAATNQLPNNGPGDVVAIFIGTAVAVGGLHYIYGLRKQNSKF